MQDHLQLRVPRRVPLPVRLHDFRQRPRHDIDELDRQIARMIERRPARRQHLAAGHLIEIESLESGELAELPERIGGDGRGAAEER